VLLLFAGQETTTHLISSGTWLLLRHPDELRKLRDGSVSWASAVEEILRYEAPAKGMLRLTRSDLELGGQRIPAEQMLYFSIAAANRDPAQFQEPERFDVNRQDTRNLAFAHGLHYCVGALLARLEGGARAGGAVPPPARTEAQDGHSPVAREPVHARAGSCCASRSDEG